MESLSPVKQALLEIRELRAQLAQRDAERHEPIAIVGMAVRAPGDVADPAAFWELLRNGRDAITEAPADRWDNATLFDADPDAPGKVATKFGGFLRDVDQFDAPFFGLSRREAESMDPQHRLLLEVTWGALEHAGIAPDHLMGSDAGFFLGISNSDYWRALYADADAIDVYAGTGGALSVAAGRLAYFLGAHGPTLCVDTACSSSLVSLHLACQSLRLGETSLAVAGGVSLILSPEGTINFSKARMLAPDGRCKSFDALADGYVRSDGCAMLVLKTLSTARADGDRVLAVIRGSALNQDGRSNGITAPNGVAQEAVMRRALSDAGVDPHAVHYVEAHGTGTSLGDPIELRALGAVYGDGRDAADPLVVGTVKTNLGHLEAAAGVMGVVKAVLALQHEWIPAHLHAPNPTSLIDWSAQHLRLPAADGEAWPRGNQPRTVAVSSFGFSGTNAHIILAEGDATAAEDERPARPVHLIPLSARTPDALRAVAASYASLLDGPHAPLLTDVAYSAATTRAQLRWARHVVVARDATEAQRSLRHVSDGITRILQPGTDTKPRVAFLFTGYGAQFPGMGRDLYDTSPVFREVIDACSTTIEREFSLSLTEILWGVRATDLLADTLYGQAATIAIELANAALWRNWGVEPSIIAGHSLGEFAAAAFAGVITADDALRLVIARARLVSGIAADSGSMTVVSASRSLVESHVGAFASGGIELAAENGPAQVVLTGPVDALRRAEATLATHGIEFRRLVGVRHAFHSAQLDPVLNEFSTIADAIVMQPPRTAWVSGLTGALVPAGQSPARGYWAAQTRSTVQFHDVARELLRLGATAFIEVGPHPVLTSQVADVAASTSTEDTSLLMLPSMRRGGAQWNELAESVAQLFAAGGDIDWTAFASPYAGARIPLPTYPFEHKRYWIPGRATTASRPAPSAASQRWTATLRSARAQAEQAPIGVDVTGYAAHWELLERHSTALIVDTLRACGLFTTPRERATSGDAAQRGGIVESQQRLLARWLQRLVAMGLLRLDGDVYVSETALPALDPRDTMAEIEQRLAGDRPLLDYVRNCSELLTQVMTGQATSLETLFPGGTFAVAEALYTTSSSAQYINALAAASIVACAEFPTDSRPARVLEVGSGTGGTSAALISRLAGSGIEYWFTDLSDAFLSRAHERFGGQVRLRTAVFDADRTGAEQGLTRGSFDVVTAANALHAAKNITTAIANVRDLLAPGGYLLLVETVAHHAWFDISTGLIEGWQHFEDALRTDVPLLAASVWRDALLAAGFEEVVSLPEEGTVAAEMGQRVILARVPYGVQPRIAAHDDDAATNAAIAPQSAPNVATSIVRRGELEAIAPSERVPHLRTIVGDAVSTLLRRGSDEPIAITSRLMEEGIDSLMAVQLRGVLSRSLLLEPPLPATLIFEFPTIDAIAQHLHARLFSAPVPVLTARAVAPAPAERETLNEGEVRTLSDADIAALLEQRYGTAGTGQDD
ncbi:MAG: acyltransferase domain-containing protein [Gemmatimonadaceae bacterium]|nr:acyltransferase domain-containing protein [Gemmatimonadaceae bacterium]